MSKSKRAYIGKWLEKAESDMQIMDIALTSEKEHHAYDAICFHAQQAVEKYLKAYLIFFDEDIPKTHSIEILLEILSKHDSGLDAIIDAEILTPYAVEIRCPDDFVVSKDDAVEAQKIAASVKAYITAKLKLS